MLQTVVSVCVSVNVAYVYVGMAIRLNERVFMCHVRMLYILIAMR